LIDLEQVMKMKNAVDSQSLHWTEVVQYAVRARL
jgi:hypothetical protein